ncbi:hypothetical protein PsorP6_003353 [Peronosclerospora sorghi]|uniref:Uncharacterized protein n=1 Tax=Peronosclerospora sorghi TaxID=230839 RepID=A0ACC0VJD6_9STRA|nr:hypothetical protein PsorP6_003353 [Peronosclerospora sorghi]
MQGKTLLLSLAAAALTVANAESGVGKSFDTSDDGMPCHHDAESEEESGGVMATLNEEFQRSRAFLQSFFGSMEENEQVDSVDIVVIEQEANPAFDRKMACMKALETIHEEDKHLDEAESLLKSLQSVVDMVIVRVWGGASCDDLSDPELVEQCNFVLKSEGAVRKYLQQGKTDDQVCDLLSPVSDLMVTDDLSCRLCERFVQMVEQTMAQEVQQVQQVREIIGDLCDAMSADSMCHTFLQKFDAIVDWVKHGTAPVEICLRIAMCLADNDDKMSTSEELEGYIGYAELIDLPLVEDEEKSTSSNDDSCFFCSRIAFLIHHISNTLPYKLPVAKDMLSSVCPMVSLKYECNVLDEKFDQLVELDSIGMRPNEICMSFDMCKTTEDGKLGALDVSKTAGLRSEWPPANDSQCTYCEFATTVAKIALEEYGADIRQIRAYADMICDMLGEDSPCHIYVKQLDFVIDSISKGMSSKAICVGLNFCTSENDDDESVAIDVILKEQPRHDSLTEDLVAYEPNQLKMAQNLIKVSSDSCFFCAQVASLLEVAISEDPSQITKINQIVNVVCEVLPSDNQCHSLLVQLDTMVNQLKKGENPKEICYKLQFCEVDSNPALVKLAIPDMSAVQNQEKGSNYCAYCSGVVTVLKYALDQKPLQVSKMRDAAGAMCELLPTDDTCYNDLELFDEAVINLKSGMEPQEVCQALKLCTSVEDRKDELMSGLLDYTGGDFLPSRCTACQQNTLLLASLITHPESLATFEREISSVCRLIPESSECELLLKHQDAIIELLRQNEDVDSICSQIGECRLNAEKEEDEGAKSLSVGCLFCEFTADIMERAQHSETALVEAKVTLETMCAILPPLARCDVLSSKFDELLSLVREGKRPSEACHAIALCDAQFIFSPTSESEQDPIIDAFEEARQRLASTMEP